METHIQDSQQDDLLDENGEKLVNARVKLPSKIKEDAEKLAETRRISFADLVRHALTAELAAASEEGASGQAAPPPAIPPAVLRALLSNVCEARWMAGEAMVNVYSAAAFSRQLLRRSVTDEDDVAALRTELNTSVQTAIADGKEAATAYANEVLQYLGLSTPEPSK